MRLAHNEELRRGQDAHQEGVFLSLAFQELCPPEHMGVDLAPDLFRDTREKTGHRPESDVAEHQQVHIALGSFLTAGDGTEYESPFDLRIRQDGSQEIHEPTRFQDKAADFRVKGMKSVRRVDNPIPILLRVNEAKPAKLLEFLLYRPNARSRAALDLPHVKRATRCAEQETKYLGTGARRK